MSAALALSLLLSLPAPTEAPPYVLVTRTGVEIQAQAPPTLDGNLLVFRTWPAGTLVRMRREALDLQATGRRNGEAPPIPVPAGARPPAPPAPSPVFTNRDLKSGAAFGIQATGIAPSPTAPSGSEDGSAGEEAAPPGASAESETQWRARAQALRDREARLREQEAFLQRKADSWKAYGISTGTLGGNTVASQYNEAAEELEQVRSALAGATREMETFQEEARRRGIPPGWLR